MTSQTDMSTLNPYKNGVFCKCPRCGKGNLLKGLLSVRERCDACGLDYGFADAADGPAVFVTFIVGFLATGGALALEFGLNPSWWVHLLVWPPVVMGLSLLFLRPLKGLLINLQYVNKAEEAKVQEDAS